MSCHVNIASESSSSSSVTTPNSLRSCFTSAIFTISRSEGGRGFHSTSPSSSELELRLRAGVTSTSALTFLHKSAKENFKKVLMCPTTATTLSLTPCPHRQKREGKGMVSGTEQNWSPSGKQGKKVEKTKLTSSHRFLVASSHFSPRRVRIFSGESSPATTRRRIGYTSKA